MKPQITTTGWVKFALRVAQNDMRNLACIFGKATEMEKKIEMGIPLG